MSNFISDDLIKNLEEAQWEAEFGEDRLRLLQEEDDNASVGEQGHDGCFPKSEIWTVWVNRVHIRGFLIHFFNIEEAYAYAVSYLYHHEPNPEIFCKRTSLPIHNLVKSYKVLYIGKSANLQTAIFKGALPPTEIKVLAKHRFYKISPSHALNLSPSETPVSVIEEGYISKVQISKYDSKDWKSFLSEDTLSKIN